MALLRLGDHVFNTDYIVRVRLNDVTAFSDNCVTLLVDEGMGTLTTGPDGTSGHWGVQAYAFYGDEADMLRGFFTDPGYVLDLTPIAVEVDEPVAAETNGQES
ncbi:MAG: hypothetical protein IGQ88_04540 [Gloeomargaritaceae cyanobacterium C42_A2020_066]|nr:hypothetical protein [Gloeomargaritaceae cyanobacterium C42_A2020_066]